MKDLLRKGEVCTVKNVRGYLYEIECQLLEYRFKLGVE